MATASLPFFKVMLDGFSRSMRMPSKFSRNFIGEEGWRKAKLTSSMGKTWTVEVCKDADGFHWFGDGWGDFVGAHGIGFGYFLLFHHEGGSSFHVTIFDRSQCNVRYTAVADGIKDAAAVAERPKSEARVVSTAATRHQRSVAARSLLMESKFRVTLRRSNFIAAKQYMHIPRMFLAWNDLSGVRRAVLSTPAGRWSVDLAHIRRPKVTDVHFTHGWGRFWSANGLKMGDVCVFKMLSVDDGQVDFIVSKE